MIKYFKKIIFLILLIFLCNKLYSAELESNATSIFTIINEKKIARRYSLQIF